MTPELDTKLCQKYPKIFVDRNKSASESCMHWGLTVGDGWYNLIDVTCGTIQSHIDYSEKRASENVEHNKMVVAARAGDFSLFNQRFEKIDQPWLTKYREQVLKIETDQDTLLGYGNGLRSITPPIPQLIADQVKEKFAGLRFYHHGGDEFCDGVLALAENLSTRICEQCGAPGKVGGRGWIKTACPAHYRLGEEETYRDRNE